MSTNTGSSRVGLNIGLGVVLVAVVALVIVFQSRTVARVAAVTQGLAVNAVPGSVIVRAEYDQPLVCEVAGRVMEQDFNLDPGKRVKKGDVLARIDPTDLQLEIDSIEIAYRAAKERIDYGDKNGSPKELARQTAKENLDQAERMYALKGLAEADIIRQRRAYQGVVQEVETEKIENKKLLEGFENQLKIKRRQLEKMTLTAQFDGIVSEGLVHPGALINANTALAIVIAEHRVIEAKISQENFSDIKVGQKATVRFLGHDNDTYQATTIKILPTADADTQRYIVHLDVKAPPELLVPGLTGEVAIVVGERQAQALVPRRAVFGNNIFVVADGRVQRRTVEVGYVGLNLTEITKGLKVGEQVIVDELDRFNDGDRVKAELIP
jgi:RND family efflux transporter MFP subunit